MELINNANNDWLKAKHEMLKELARELKLYQHLYEFNEYKVQSWLLVRFRIKDEN